MTYDLCTMHPRRIHLVICSICVILLQPTDTSGTRKITSQPLLLRHFCPDVIQMAVNEFSYSYSKEVPLRRNINAKRTIETQEFILRKNEEHTEY